MTDSAYGLWPLVVINTAIVLMFAFSFTRPKTKRDWASFGTFGAFMLALFTEMYGFPLTIYLLSGYARVRHPQYDAYAARVPRFVPRKKTRLSGATPHEHA